MVTRYIYPELCWFLTTPTSPIGSIMGLPRCGGEQRLSSLAQGMVQEQNWTLRFPVGVQLGFHYIVSVLFVVLDHFIIILW